MIKKSLLLLAAACATSSFAVGTPTPLDPLFASRAAETRAALLIVGGKVAAKRYAPGYSDANRFISWSMAKSVTAVLVGELVADGKLQLDAPVPFAEWQTAGDPRAKITLRHMLNMASGLDHTEGLDPDDGANGALKSDTSSTLFVRGTDNMAERGIAKGLEAAPGAKYEYSSITSLMLSELITRQLTGSKDARTRAAAYRAFAEERLFKPAGITSAVVEFDGAGTQIGGSIIYMTLDDWGRFGSVLMAGKGADGGQVIAPDWLTFLRTPSPTNPGYGGHIWLNSFPLTAHTGWPLPKTIYSANGHLGQWVITSPEQDMVLVRLGKTNDGDLEPVKQALGAIISGVRVKGLLAKISQN